MRPEAVGCSVETSRNSMAEFSAMSDFNTLSTASSTSLCCFPNASAIFRGKQIYEALHPETVNGGDRRSSDCQIGELKADRFTSATGGGHNQLRQIGEAADRFTAATAFATGKAERNIQRAAARGEALGDDLEAIVGKSLDRGVELASSGLVSLRPFVTALAL